MVLIAPVPKRELSVNEVFREWQNLVHHTLSEYTKEGLGRRLVLTKVLIKI